MKESRHYHMYEEILAQPQHVLALGEAAARGADAAAGILSGKAPLLVGCGTSLFAAELAASYLYERGGSVLASGAFPLLQRRVPLDRRHPIVALSHSGETAAVLDLLAAAREREVPTVLVTGFPDSTAASLASATVATGYARELSWCHTISFTLSSLMAVELLKACAIQLPPGLTPPTPVKVAEGIEAVLRHEDAIAREAEAILDGRRVILGAAEGLPLAREVGLKLSEAAYLENQALELEQFFHGYVPAYGPGDHALAILPPASGHRAQDLAKVADIVGLSLLALDLQTFAAWTPAADADTFPWLAAVYLQLLTYHAALLRGTDPDQLRREDPRYLAARRAYR